MFVMLSRLFNASLWSPAVKGLTSWLSFVMFDCVLSRSNVVSCVFLIFTMQEWLLLFDSCLTIVFVKSETPTEITFSFSIL